MPSISCALGRHLGNADALRLLCFYVAPHLLPFWFLFVDGSPPSAWRACSKRKCIGCQDCLAEDAKKGSFLVFSAKQSSHTHTKQGQCRTQRVAALTFLCVSGGHARMYRVSFLVFSARQSSRTPQTKVNAACICCLDFGLCVWGP